MLKGTKHSEETRRKMRLAWTSERKRITSERLKGRYFSEEHKRKISETKKKLYKKGIIVNPFRGKRHSEETKRKLRESHLGLKASEEARRKMSETRKGAKNYNYGKHLSEDTKRKLSLANKGYRHTEEAKIKMSIAGRGKKRSEETRRRMSESRKGWIYAESTLRKMSNAKIGKKLSDEHRRKLSEARRGEKHPFYGKHLSAIHKNNIRKAKIGTKYTEEQKRKLSELWKKRVKEGRMPRKILKIPNSKEIVLLDIIKELGLPYKFVGDHSFWIGGKNPDFLNVNGKKKVIELFGDYWHNLDGRMSEKERKKHFKKYGFDCLVIWEKELKDMEQVKNKIRDFDSPWLECP